MQECVDDQVARVRQQWAVERPRLDTWPMAVIGRILRAEHLATADMRRQFRRYGLDRAGFDALATLRRSGKPYRLTPTQLSKELILTSGAITHVLDSLERVGLVRRSPSQHDRRSATIALTAEGRKLVDRVMDAHMQLEAGMCTHLSTAEQSALAELLAKLLHGMEQRRESG